MIIITISLRKEDNVLVGLGDDARFIIRIRVRRCEVMWIGIYSFFLLLLPLPLPLPLPFLFFLLFPFPLSSLLDWLPLPLPFEGLASHPMRSPVCAATGVSDAEGEEDIIVQ